MLEDASLFFRIAISFPDCSKTSLNDLSSAVSCRPVLHVPVLNYKQAILP